MKSCIGLANCNSKSAACSAMMVAACCFLMCLDCKPTMPQLTNFPGKTRHFNIALEIGVKYFAVGIALLNDERGTLLPAIRSEHRGNAEQINMDIY